MDRTVGKAWRSISQEFMIRGAWRGKLNEGLIDCLLCTVHGSVQASAIKELNDTIFFGGYLFALS